MNKLFFRLSLLFLIAGIGFVSCSKEEFNVKPSQVENTQIESLQSNVEELKNPTQFLTKDLKIADATFQSEYGDFYFVDEKQVDFEKFDYNDISNYTGYTVNEDGSWNVWEFTTKVKYIDWGRKNSFPVEKQLRIQDALTNYIADNNVIERYEKTGNIPEDYTRFQKRLFEKNGQSENQRIFPIVLGKECPWNTGAVWPFFNSLAFMPPGWNNKTSSWDRIGIYGGLVMYDKTWFRRYMGTVWDWGINAQCLPWWADNRISSCLNAG